MTARNRYWITEVQLNILKTKTPLPDRIRIIDELKKSQKIGNDKDLRDLLKSKPKDKIGCGKDVGLKRCGDGYFDGAGTMLCSSCISKLETKND